MKGKRYSEEQIICILEEVEEGKPPALEGRGIAAQAKSPEKTGCWTV